MFKAQRLEIEPGTFIDRFEPSKPLAKASLADVAGSMVVFDPHDWYWQIKGDAGFVWSSKRALRVSIEEAAFKTWMAEGGRLTYIASVEEMREVWGKHGLVQDAAAQYREIRARRYIAELGKPGTTEEPSFQNTTGDVLDILITQVEAMRQALGAAATPEFAALIASIQTIKAEVPKG